MESKGRTIFMALLLCVPRPWLESQPFPVVTKPVTEAF